MVKAKTDITQNFLKPKLNFKNISKFRFWSGILLHLFYAYILTNFFVLLLEFLTIAKDGFSYSIKSFIEYREYKFYVFFISFYTICYVSFLMIDYWYNKPERTLKSKKARKYITYERKAFQNTTILWLFRLIVFTLIFKYDGISQCLQLYVHYKYLFVLIAMVVFLDLSLGFRRVFKLKKRHFFYSFFIVVSLSFLFTFLRPYDDREMLKFINKGINSKNLILPSVSLKYGDSQAYCRDRVYMTADNKIFIGNEMEVSNENFRYYLPEAELYNYRQFWCLYIDRNTLMKDFNRIKLDMIRADKLKVHIIIENKSKLCQNQPSGIIMGFPSYGFIYKNDTRPNPPPPPPRLENFLIEDSNVISIQITENNLYFNGIECELNDLEKLIFKELKINKVFVLKYTPTTTFQRYLEIYVAINNSVYSKRDKLSISATGLDYFDLKDRVYWNEVDLDFKQIFENINEDAPMRVDDRFINYLK